MPPRFLSQQCHSVCLWLACLHLYVSRPPERILATSQSGSWEPRANHGSYATRVGAVGGLTFRPLRPTGSWVPAARSPQRSKDYNATCTPGGLIRSDTSELSCCALPSSDLLVLTLPCMWPPPVIPDRVNGNPIPCRWEVKAYAPNPWVLPLRHPDQVYGAPTFVSTHTKSMS